MELVEKRLAIHGLAVMGPWIRWGVVFTRLAEKCGESHLGNLHATDEEIAAVMRMSDDITADTVWETIEKLKRDARANKSWDPEKDASLETYFITGCLLKFKDVFRRYRRNHLLSPPVEYHREKHTSRAVITQLADFDEITERIALESRRAEARDQLDLLTNNERLIVWCLAKQLKDDEIAPLVDGSSRLVHDTIRRLEGRYAWVTTLRQQRDTAIAKSKKGSR